MHQAVHIAPASASDADTGTGKDKDKDGKDRPKKFCRRPCRAEDLLPVECATYVDEATKLLVSCSEDTEMRRNVDAVSDTWFRVSFSNLPRLRLNVMQQLLTTCPTPKKFAADVCKNTVMLECWKTSAAGASASASASSSKSRKGRARPRKAKTYVTVQEFPHVSEQDLRHVNEVLNALCQRYLFMKKFPVTILLSNTSVIVRVGVRDVLDLDDLVMLKRDWCSVIYDMVLDFPQHTLNVYMRTSDAASSHLASEKLAR